MLRTDLDDLRCLSQKNVSNLEPRKIRIALTVLSSIPELYCLTALTVFIKLMTKVFSHKFYEDWPLTLPDEVSCQYN